MIYKIVSLGEVVAVKGGGTPSRKVTEYWNGDISWATVKDLKTQALCKTQESITRNGLKHSASNLIPTGTVITATRMALGRAAITEQDMAINQDLKALFCSEALAPRYLLHFLNANKLQIESMGKGATVKGITLDILLGLKIPLPLLEEQKRIAAILDKADAIRKKRQQAIELTEQFLRSAFLDMFGDSITNPKGFPVGTIRELVSDVRYGTSSKAGTLGKYPILRMGNITYTGGWNFSDLKYINLSEKEESKYLVKKGDLLFNRTNSKELVGKSAVYRNDELMAYAGYLIRMRPNEFATNDYISGYLNSSHGKATLQHICKSIVGMANINAQELQNIKILIPPIAMQEKYSKLVEAVYAKLAKHCLIEKNAHSLFNSLVQRVFRGEL